MAKLPGVVYSDGIRKYKETRFGGYDHRLGAGDGTLWDMENLTSDYAPLLGTRRPRYLMTTLIKPNGFYCRDAMFWVDGTTLYVDGVEVGTVEDSRKTFATLGAYVVILPDKAYYKIEVVNGKVEPTAGEFGMLEETLENESAVITDGTYAGEPAEANTILLSSTTTGFRAGDAVTISGARTHPENNQTLIIREVGMDQGRAALRFYENTFVINQGGDSETLTISRAMPDLDYICENENRLWGCKGDMIYASKLGDPFNWNVMDGLSDDSYQAPVGSAGDFTGCASLLGYPCFFKEEHIYKVYGDRPATFQVMGSASLGIEAESGMSPAIAGEIMFYKARTGIVAYSGGIPQSINGVFGTERYKKAVGGSDGRKYYVSMLDTGGDWHLFAYDTATGLWHREDGKEIIGFGWLDALYFLDAEGNLWCNGDARAQPEDSTVETPLTSMAEFGDFAEAESGSSGPQPNKKGTAKLQLRIELEADSSVGIQMMFDSSGVWETVATLTTHVKRSYYLPIIPRRSDHFRIRITGSGQWRLYSLVREHYVGSEL